MSAHSAAAEAAAIAEVVVAGEAVVVEIHNLAMKMHLCPTTQGRLQSRLWSRIRTMIRKRLARQ